jgi:hypothetical protein
MRVLGQAWQTDLPEDDRHFTVEQDMSSFKYGSGRMNAASKLLTVPAFFAAFAQTAFAGDYSGGPVVEDGGSNAGLILLLAVGALLVIRAIANPKPVDGAADTPDTTDTTE